MKIRKYVIEETEHGGLYCTSSPTSTVTPPIQLTVDLVEEKGRDCALKAYDDNLTDSDKLELYELVLHSIVHVLCTDPSGCARAALKIKDLDTIRD